MRTTLASLFLGFSFCLAACSGAPDPAGDLADDEVGQTQDELHVSSRLVGHYYTRASIPGGFYTLDLERGGRYTAKVDITDRAMCVRAPCVVSESGSWYAYAAGRDTRLAISPQGKARQIYKAVKTAGKLELARAGRTQTLKIASAPVCEFDSECDAGELCAPGICYMYCQPSDPDCCAPSTCQKKPDPCWGAWTDQNGVCRTPADGVYPQSCCQTGPTCGPNTCAVGEVCCNSLSGICTPPGGVCAF